MSVPGFSLEDIVDQVTGYREQQQLAKYLAIVSLALLVYDWIISIDREVEFIWGHPWSWGRVVYHANRVWSLTLLGTSLTVIIFLPLPSIST
ncbi:unnamed protein product [Rhizoctonia solani]|uniref:DUF6533 domain-containing protein n=1 Tax=Rhizoctonia solani TaxID=456999 RepID=A0A8H3AIU7_9AGAM|nr:unnamed protein product [Rhizoctonia solani]